MESGKEPTQQEIEKPAEQNPYKNSTLVAKLVERQQQDLPLRIAFLDIDSTLTGNSKCSKQVRQQLDQLGFGVVFVSSRPEEMMMSKQEYDNSHGFTRPPPKLGRHTNSSKRFLAFPEELLEHTGLYNPDIIAGTTGTRIMVHQKDGGFTTDKSFENDIQKGNKEWHDFTLGTVEYLLDRIDPKRQIAFSPAVNYQKTYEQNDIDVTPPDFRVHVDFLAPKAELGIYSTGATSGGKLVPKEQAEIAKSARDAFLKEFDELRFGDQELRKKDHKLISQMQKELEKLRKDLDEKTYRTTVEKVNERYRSERLELYEAEATDPRLLNIRLTEDSNPAEGRFSLYLTPNRGYKARAEESILTHVSHELGIERANLETFMVGDSSPDVNMGLYGGLGTRAHFLLVGGSRLNSVFTDKSVNDFAGKNFLAIKQRLMPIRDGEYKFITPLSDTRDVIVGDKKYPGTRGPETVLAYLQDKFSLSPDSLSTSKS